MKKLITFSILILNATNVFAISINEIMYDPVGSDSSREWVEIYNDTGTSINLTSYKLFESGTNHGINSYSGGTIIDINNYGVIADNPQKFLLDFPTYTGALYDSSFSLINSGEQLILKDSNLNSINEVTYIPSIGGADDGSTLSFINGSFTRGEATPGKENIFSELISNNTQSSTTENQSTIAQVSPPSPDIVLYLPFEKTVVAGADTEFSTYGMTRSGRVIENLTSTWAFGDGGQSSGTSTKYRYVYPGRYIAQAEATDGQVLGIGKMIVRVVPPDIIISKVGSGKYGTYIDINNPNVYDIDLSQWRLLIDNISYPFPKNTVISKNNTTHFSGLAMGFASTTVSTSTEIKVLFPNLEEVTRYNQTSSTNKPSTILVASLPIVIPKPVAKGIQATTTNKITIKQKDTRLIMWVKSFFSKQ